MPRAVDPSLVGQQLPITHSPLNRINDQIRMPEGFSLDDLLAGLTTFITDFLFPGIENLTGIALSAFLPILNLLNLDFSSPDGFISSFSKTLLEIPLFIVEIIKKLVSSAIGFLFNGLIPVSHVGQAAPNLLVNPKFEGVESVGGSGIWFWHATEGNTTPGSAYTTATGVLKQLVSNDIPVAKGQKLHLSVWLKWAGLVYTAASPITMQIVRKRNGVPVGTVDIAAPAAITADQASWVQISGDYTVPDDCDMVCMQLSIADTATAGTIYFDDGDVHKTGLLAPSWMSGFLGGTTILDDIQGFVDVIWQSITGFADVGKFLEDIFAALRNIPFLNILGIGGPSNIGNSILETWIQLISGFVGAIGGGAAGLSDLFNVGYQVSSNATLGAWGWDILGIRNNKPLEGGLLSSSQSNFAMSRIGLQSSAPTFALTQSTATIGFHRIEQATDKTVVSWLGYGVTSITAFRIRVWQMDTDTGVMTLVYNSSNVVADIATAMGWNIHTLEPAGFVSPRTNLHVEAGEVYGIELSVVGAGTHNIAGQPTWLPNHPTVYPKNMAAVRNSGTTDPATSPITPGVTSGVTYATNVPWIELGDAITGVLPPHAPFTTLFNTEGPATADIPAWANYIDVIALGAGGGGHQGGAFLVYGECGYAGDWASATWVRDTDFTSSETEVHITIGTGGSPGTGPGTEPTATGGNGGNTTASITGHTVTATGGAGGTHFNSGGNAGEAAGNQTYLGLTYAGGSAQGNPGFAGVAPGGGGGGGAGYLHSQPGGAGATGAAWIVFRQT